MHPFHPAVADWFRRRFGEPTEPQRLGWPRIQQGKHVLIAAPTGSGKTLAAFLCAIDQLVHRLEQNPEDDRTRVLYISPLKALANDIQQNLLGPLEQIRRRAEAAGRPLPEIRPLVRTGDTLARERAAMLRKPPHILVTTPESLFILLTSRNGRNLLRPVETVIVDEIHALAGNKRGSHLALSLERLEALTGRPFQRIGLSATQKPVACVARFLGGPQRHADVIDIGHRRRLDLAVEVPGSELGAVAGNDIWKEVYERLAQLILQERSTLVFVNTRRLAERLAHQLEELLGTGQVASHHGSLSRLIRLDVESRLRSGALRAVVATASLELGLDIGHVDLVCQIGSTRSIALALQRIGRSGHWKGAVPRGRFFATTRDELLECASLVWAIRQGDLDRLHIPEAPLDILAQQIVASAASDEWEEDELFRVITRAAPYAGLSRTRFDEVVALLAEGISARQGRRAAYLFRDRIHGRIRGRRGARLAAITSGGAIPENAAYLVKAEPDETVVGTLDEDFAVESMQGDIFLLGNTSWRIRKVESGTVRVEDARGAPPNIPFWTGEAPGRSDELSQWFARLRAELVRLAPQEALGWLARECGLAEGGARQAVDYVKEGAASLGSLPGLDCVVAERFFDESGGMQLVLHAPFGARINKAWGLALRKRFCRSFNFELQSAATDNGIVISLSDQHSFPLQAVFGFLSTQTLHETLTQALLDSPLFTARWRWNATRSLAVLRFSGGRKVPPPIQRMRSDDLLAAVFPDQVACLENIQGDRRIPDHPLVAQTIHDCLTEAFDEAGLLRLLEGIERGHIRTVAIDTREPSPFSHEILNANPYAFLDNAPLEERRARAVQLRRGPLPEDARELGRLDQTAIDRVVEEAAPPLRSADEVHDALLSCGILSSEELQGSGTLLEELASAGRICRFQFSPPGKEELVTCWFALERFGLVTLIYPPAAAQPVQARDAAERTAWQRDQGLSRGGAIRELIRARMEVSGPVTSGELAGRLALVPGEIDIALAELEAEGQILRGQFRPGQAELEWCDRRLLGRIHRLTLGRLRREIEPVNIAQFMEFLFHWQHLPSRNRLHGEAGLAQILEQLAGFEAPASAWESFIFPLRLAGYDPEWLDHLCLGGRFAWGRLTPPVASLNGSDGEDSGSRRPVRPTCLAPVAFLERSDLPRVVLTEFPPLPLSPAAEDVLAHLNRWGATFPQELVAATGRLPLEIEEGLWELVAGGRVTADGFDNLRALMDPRRRLAVRAAQRRRRASTSLGRWTLLRRPGHHPADSTEWWARCLLRRWGVMFRDLLGRETAAPPWRDLVGCYRRLEARGEVRGGRFVGGCSGEQFALSEALDSLRALRNQPPAAGQVFRISAADPLNLAGILLPGRRVRPHPETALVWQEGQLLEENPPPLPGARLAAAEGVAKVP